MSSLFHLHICMYVTCMHEGTFRHVNARQFPCWTLSPSDTFPHGQFPSGHPNSPGTIGYFLPDWSFGVSGTLLSWLSSFLSERSMCVVHGLSRSSWVPPPMVSPKGLS